MKPLARRKFISLAALSGAGLASLSAQDHLARSAEGHATIGGAMEQHAAADGNRVTEEIKKEKIRRAMLAGPASVTSEATIVEMDRQGNMTVLALARAIGFVSQAIRTLLGGQIWPLIRWAWSGSKIFLSESPSQRTPPLA
jgi:hypothetical protein